MAKQNYSQEDFARAILRMGISNCNEKLDEIIASYLGGATIVDDDHGSFVVDEHRNNWQGINRFHQAHKYLNNRFFFSPQNSSSAGIIGQAYWALGSGKDVYSLMSESERCTDVRVHLDPVFKAVLKRHKQKIADVRTYYYNQVYREKITEEYAEKKIKEHTSVLSGEKYEEFLKENGFSGKELEQAKLFIDIMNYQNTNARVVDFLDIYTLYHYYIFKKGICNRFFKLIKDNPGLSRTKMCYEYEKIVAEEIHKHCEKYSCDKNAYFQRSKMSLHPTKMDTAKARKLTIEFHRMPEPLKKLVAEKIEGIINESVEVGKKLNVVEIYTNPHTGVNGAIIKNGNPNIRRKGRSSITTNVKTILKTQEKEKLVGTETVAPNLPKVGKARVVEVSKLRPFTSPRIEREKQKKQAREEAKRKQAERDKEYTQLSLFPDDNVM